MVAAHGRRRMRRPGRCRPSQAPLGPCIRPGCYEFGEPTSSTAVVAALRRPRCARPPPSGTPALDLPAAVRGGARRGRRRTRCDDTGRLHRVRPSAGTATAPAGDAGRFATRGLDRGRMIDACVDDVASQAVARRARADRRGRRRPRRDPRCVAVTKGFGPDAGAGGRSTPGSPTSARTTPRSWSPRPPPSRIPRTRPRSAAGTSSGGCSATRCARSRRCVHLWQSVDRLVAGRRDRPAAPGAAVLVQVNVSGEPRRAGARPAARRPRSPRAAGPRASRCAGLMAVGPPGPPEAARAGVPPRCVALADELEPRRSARWA